MVPFNINIKTSASILLYTLSQLHGAHATCTKYLTAAQAAAASLQSNYFNSAGTYGDQAVWIGAVDTFYLERLDAIASTTNYTNVINTVFDGNEDYLANGQSYDDVQWVAIAYLGAGNATGAKFYYDIGSTALDSTYCGGGLFWSGARDYKNSITNELYMASSGYMYEATQDEQYLANLKDIWTWVQSSKLRGSNGLFNDGLTKDGTCANNGQTQWTYNQGVVLVGLAYLSKYAQDDDAVTTAFGIMDDIISDSDMTINGGLREACESNSVNKCSSDAQTFKGILTYYMAWFLRVSGKDQGTKYTDFVKAQADLVLKNAVSSSGGALYTNLWYDTASGTDATTTSSSTQGSALGALVAAAEQNC